MARIRRNRIIQNPPRLRGAFWELRVSYNGGPKATVDNSISKAVGKPSLGSGCTLTGKMTRDWSWEFTSPSLAKSAAKRVLHAVQSSFKKEGTKTKVRVEVWDTKPRRILLDGGPQ